MYLERFPHLGDDEDAVIELIYSEYVIREELGEHAALSVVRQGFPARAGRLGRLFEFHKILEEGEPLSLPSVRADRGSREEQGVARSRRPCAGAAREIGRGGMGVVYRAGSRLNRSSP